MKYLKYLGFLLISLLPLNVDALISFNCNGPAKPNTEISCYISSDEKISKFDANLGVDSKVTYFGVLPGSFFENQTTNRNLKFTSDVGGTAIATVKIYVPSNLANDSTFTIQLADIKYIYIGETIERTRTDINETVRVVVPTTTKKTTTTTVASGTQKTFTVTLENNNGTNMKNTLSCNTTGSNCNIDLSSVAVPAKAGSVFAGWGNKASCTSGSKTSYKADSNTTLYACWTSISITTPVTTNPITTSGITPGGTLYLKTLEIEGQVLEFSKFKFTYDLTVLYEIESLVIKAEAATEGVKVEVGDASTLEVGENKIIIKLASTEGQTSDYLINVKRLKEGEIIKDLSSDATLKSVSFGKYTVKFSPTVVDYTIEIDSKTNSIPVTAEATDENATFEIEGNTDLTDASIIKITVTAEDGTTNTYNFRISIKKGFLESNKMYLGIAGALFLLLIILLIINKIQKNKSKPVSTSKAPTRKVPTTSPKSVTRNVPKPTSPNTDPKSKVEVLDI